MFAEFWQHNGGQSVFGAALGSPVSVIDPDSGAGRLAQWYQNSRLELLTEPTRIVVARLGAERLQVLTSADASAIPTAPDPIPPEDSGCLWFDQTQHAVCDTPGGPPFASFWSTHGIDDPLLDATQRSLAVFGLPLTSVILANEPDGTVAAVQWFERARFEWQSDGGAVRLGALGRESLENRAPSSPRPVPMLPPNDAPTPSPR